MTGASVCEYILYNENVASLLAAVYDIGDDCAVWTAEKSAATPLAKRGAS